MNYSYTDRIPYRIYLYELTNSSSVLSSIIFWRLHVPTICLVPKIIHLVFFKFIVNLFCLHRTESKESCLSNLSRARVGDLSDDIKKMSSANKKIVVFLTVKLTLVILGLQMSLGAT